MQRKIHALEKNLSPPPAITAEDNGEAAKIVTAGNRGNNQGGTTRRVFSHDVGYASLEEKESPPLSSAMRLADSGLACIVSSGLEMNIIGRRHLRKLHRSNIPFTTAPLRAPFITAGTIGTEKDYVYEIVSIHALRLKPNGGVVELRLFEFYLLEDADVMILGLPFIDATGHNCGDYLTDNRQWIHGLDF